MTISNQTPYSPPVRVLKRSQRALAELDGHLQYTGTVAAVEGRPPQEHARLSRRTERKSACCNFSSAFSHRIPQQAAMQPLLNPISAAPKRKHPSYSGVAPSFAPESAAGPSSSSAGKRTRFADQESDEAHAQGSLPGVDIDLLEQDAKRNQQGRKGRIVTDGYDSEEESEDEEEEQDKDQEDGDGGLEADGADEEEEDMFGDGNAGDVDVAKARAKGKEQDKKKKGGKEGYLELGDIDGQEFDAQRDQTGDVLSDESDRDEERDPELELEGEDEDEDEDDEEGGDAKGKGKAKAGKKGKSADPFDDMVS